MNGCHGYPYKRSFIDSNILETSKDRPNTPPSLKFVKQRVHESVGGPPTPLDDVLGSKRLRSGRVLKHLHFNCSLDQRFQRMPKAQKAVFRTSKRSKQLPWRWALFGTSIQGSLIVAHMILNSSYQRENGNLA